MQKLIATFAAGLFSLSAIGQTYPSPTFNSLTLQNPLTVVNGGTGASTSTGSGSLVLSASPTIANPTVTSAFNATGLVTTADLASQAANTVLANASASTASPAAFAMPSCSGSNNALRWTSGTGFTCASAIALTSGTLAQFAATTSAQLAGVISDETGSGSLVFSTSPTIGAPTISGGTIDNASIGATTPASGKFTTFSASGASSFTLSPTGPTPAIGDNSSKFATTTFVQAAIPSYPALSYGVKCDGVTNDAPAMQTLINNIITAGGGTIILPKGNCLIPGGITENLSSYSGYTKPYVNFQGQGQLLSSMTDSTLSVALNIIGSSSSDVAQLNLSHFSLYGTSTTNGSVGLQTADTAYLHLEDFGIQGFTNGWVATDIEQTSIEHSNFLFNGNGVVINGVVNATGSNSISFYDSAIANNTSSGLLIKDFNAVSFYNGSIQYNGSVGVSGEHGVLLEDTAGGTTCGYNTASFYGTIFEGNGGDYDIDMLTNYCPGASLTLNAVSFARTFGYATSNIQTGGTLPNTITLTGSTFISSSAYTPSSSRPNINFAGNTSTVLYDSGSNYFQNTVEGPNYVQKQMGYPAPQMGAWIPFTPVGACGTGTLGSGTFSGRYKYLGQKTVAIEVTAALTGVGTCTNGLYMTMPTGVVVNSAALYPVLNINGGTGNSTQAAVATHNAGIDSIEIFGAPVITTYLLNGTFETQ